LSEERQGGAGVIDDSCGADVHGSSGNGGYVSIASPDINGEDHDSK